MVEDLSTLSRGSHWASLLGHHKQYIDQCLGVHRFHAYAQLFCRADDSDYCYAASS